MIRICAIELFHYDELAPDAQARVRDWLREGDYPWDEWYEATIEDAKTCFALCGFEIAHIHFSGFWSQGDGACFEGTWDADKVQAAKLRQHAPKDRELHRIAKELRAVARKHKDAHMTIKHRGYYSHEFCTEIEVGFLCDRIERMEYDSPAYKARDKLLGAVQDQLSTLARDAMRWIYRQLQAEYEYQMSDEQVAETIRANEYEFTAEGRRHA